MHALLALLLGIGLFVALPGLWLYFNQGAVLYPAPSVAVPSQTPPGVERIELGETYGLLLAPPADKDGPSAVSHRHPALIYAHGNGEVAYQSLRHFEAFRRAGYVVLLLEFPGYGGAGGEPNQTSIERAVLAAFDTLVARSDIAADAIVAYGRSMGGGAASVLAAERPIAALCLESTFTSLSRLVSEKGMPAFLLRDRYDTEEIISKLRIPIFIFHGEEDTLIPFQHARDLAKAAKHSVFRSAHCGHNDCPRPFQEILLFLSGALRLGNAPSAATP